MLGILETDKKCLVTAEIDLSLADDNVNTVSIKRLIIQPSKDLLQMHRLFKVDGQLTKLGLDILCAGFISAMANATSLSAMREHNDEGILNEQVLKAIETRPWDISDKNPGCSISQYLLRIAEGEVEYYVIAFWNDGEDTIEEEGWYIYDSENEPLGLGKKMEHDKVKGYIKLG